MRILQYPKVQQISGSDWVLLEDLEYHVGSEDSTDIITVPAGYKTDFASVPRAFWSIFPPFGKYSSAAVIHDYLYGTRSRPRKECDKIFLECMEVLGVNWITRHTLYRSVRMFGMFAY